MQLSFHGAAKTVTGSQHLIKVNGTNILLDCGLYQGHRAESYERNLKLPYKASEIDILVLSHAHIDHSGNIPNLVKQGFRGDIICTAASRDLAATMLPDSGFIQERDAEYINKHRNQRRKFNDYAIPIYTSEDAINSLEYFITQGYYRCRQIAPDVYLTFFDAGHMLGSCIVQLDISDHETHRDFRLVFSGDLGRKGIPIIRDPETIEGADYLILESTYGNRLHESYEDSEKRLKQIVIETHKRGGSIIMPAFAVGRTQQLVLSLHQLTERGEIPRMPIFVDSPLAVDATAVFRLHPECYDSEIRAFMNEFEVKNPFGFDDLRYVREVSESKKLNLLEEPHIVISASGMAEFGRILHHLKHGIQNPRNTVLITGFQAENTLGRRLVDGAKVANIFGEKYKVHAHIEVIDGFSGHADRNELLAWVDAMSRKPKHIYLAHGEEDSIQAMKTALEQAYRAKIHSPELHQTYQF